MPEPMSGCWLWTAYTDKNGYGRFRWEDHQQPAHRVAYKALAGPILPRLVSDHLCQTPACVNPAHIEIVSIRLNTLRGNTLQAKFAATTHCPQGHPYDEQNTYVNPKGQRICRACTKNAGLAYIARDPERWRKYKREYEYARRHGLPRPSLSMSA